MRLSLAADQRYRLFTKLADIDPKAIHATLLSLLVNTTRCKLAPPGKELHSQPIKLVNLPGS